MADTVMAVKRRADGLREVVEFALGASNGRKISQRELAEKLHLAPTMVTRYLTGNVEFNSLRAITIELLAKACGLTETSVFLWIREGREAAMLFEERCRQDVTPLAPLDLARRLVMALEKGGALGQTEVELDREWVQSLLDEQRRAVGERGFAVLVEANRAESSLRRFEENEPLSGADVDILSELLNRDLCTGDQAQIGSSVR